MEKVNRFCKFAVSVLAMAILLGLGVASLIWTQPFFFYENREYMDLFAPRLRDGIKNNVLLLIFMVIFLIMLVFITKKWIKQWQIKVFLVIEMVVVFAAGCVYIWNLQALPFADSLNIITYARAFSCGDFSVFGEGKYLSMYPHQISITWFISILIRLFPNCDIYIVFQILNCVCISGILCAGYYVVHSLWNRNTVDMVYLCIQGMCLPLLFYSAHIYGELPALFLTLVFIGQFVKIIQGSKKMLWFRLPAACISIGMAMCFRKNTLIVVVAVCIISVLSLLFDKNILAGNILIAVLVGCSFPGIIQAAITGDDYDKNNSYPTVSWIDIGMHEGGGFGIGAFDGRALEIFERNNFDAEATEEEVKQCIRERMDYFLIHPKEMFQFYREKILWQWLDPTYRCFTETRLYKEGYPQGIAYEITYGKYREAVAEFMNVYQSFVYFSAALGAILIAVKREKVAGVVWSVILVGGFLFSILWEASPRYVFPYMILAIPCCAYGVAVAAENIVFKVQS